MAQISTVSLALLLGLMLALNFQNVLALFGTGAVAVTLLLVAVSVLAGYFLGGPSLDLSRVWQGGLRLTGPKILIMGFCSVGRGGTDCRVGGAGFHGPGYCAPGRWGCRDRVRSGSAGS